MFLTKKSPKISDGNSNIVVKKFLWEDYKHFCYELCVSIGSKSYCEWLSVYNAIINFRSFAPILQIYFMFISEAALLSLEPAVHKQE